MDSDKYKVISGQSFTIDKILIYNLFVYNIPENATVPKVTEYFEKFGKVFRVRLTGKGKTLKSFVYFADPKEATKVLQERRHVFMDSIIRVEPCHSFRQPDGRRFMKFLSKQLKTVLPAIQTTNNYKSANENIQDSLILNLNDDCLQYICSYLPLNDQINFALTCQRFFNIMIMISKTDYSFLDSFTLCRLSLWRGRIFLNIVGPQVKQLKISALADKYVFNCLGSFCLNVEKLIVVSCYDMDQLRKMIENMTLLQELILIDNMFDSFIQHLKRFKHLKTLDLNSNLTITGKYIHLLNGLEKLVLNRCFSISSNHFKQICENLQNLIELDIRRCDLLETNDFEHICKHLLKLETLRFSAEEGNFDCIAELPNLKVLEIMGYENITLTENFLQKLVAFKADQLQELTIHNTCMSLEKATAIAKLKKLKVFRCQSENLDDEALYKFSQLTELQEVLLSQCHNLHNEAVLNFLEKCYKLKHVILSECDGLTPELIKNLIKLLQKPQVYWQRINRLHLNISFKYTCTDKISEIKAMDLNPDLLKVDVNSECFDQPFDESDSFDSEELNYYY